MSHNFVIISVELFIIYFFTNYLIVYFIIGIEEIISVFSSYFKLIDIISNIDIDIVSKWEIQNRNGYLINVQLLLHILLNIHLYM